MTQRSAVLPLFTTLLGALACAGGPKLPIPSQGTGLRSSSELETDCFGAPRQPFTKRNHAEVATRLQAGDRAVDFVLNDVRGTPVRLADLLTEKPVLLVQGSWTCPRFQENRLPLEDTVRRLGNDVHVVLSYNIEAHPAATDPSPYRGKAWPHDFSDRGQANSAAERTKSAREVGRDSNMTVLVDTFDAPGANPIWCTYGTCPSCSWLIRQDGVIEAVHEWHDPNSMNASIQALVSASR